MCFSIFNFSLLSDTKNDFLNFTHRTPKSWRATKSDPQKKTKGHESEGIESEDDVFHLLCSDLYVRIHKWIEKFNGDGAMMEMEANHFLDRVNRLTYDIIENVHPAHLDREEDLSDYLLGVKVVW